MIFTFTSLKYSTKKVDFVLVNHWKFMLHMLRDWPNEVDFALSFHLIYVTSLKDSACWSSFGHDHSLDIYVLCHSMWYLRYMVENIEEETEPNFILCFHWMITVYPWRDWTKWSRYDLRLSLDIYVSPLKTLPNRQDFINYTSHLGDVDSLLWRVVCGVLSCP